MTERNRAASIVNGLDEGLLLLDQDRVILLANPVACQLLAWPADQLLGRPAADVAHGKRPGPRLCCAPSSPAHVPEAPSAATSPNTARKPISALLCRIYSPSTRR